MAEAARAARGTPVYEPPEAGHATRAYGPIGPYVFGFLQRATGPNLFVSRLLSLAAAVAIWGLLIRWSGVYRNGPLVTLLAVGVFLAFAPRTQYYFVTYRPDLPALMFAVIACGLFYEARQRQSVPLVLLGSGMMLVGFGFKQTALQVAAIPLVQGALAYRRQPFTLQLFIPLIVSAVALLALKLLTPTVWYYVIEIPRRLPAEPARAGAAIAEFMLSTAAFWVFLIGLMWHARSDDDPRLTWGYAAVIVAFPASAITIANAGATTNSWLPVLLALYFTFLLALNHYVLPWLNSPRSRRQRISRLLVFAAVLLSSHLRTWTTVGHMPRRSEYSSIIEQTALLKGEIVSPEDPAVAVLAGHEPGNSVHLEMFGHTDGVFAIPQYAIDRFRKADWFIDVADWYGDPITPDSLRRWGFIQKTAVGRYAVWKNQEAATAH